MFRSPEEKRIASLAIPAILAQISQMLFGLVDTVMASHHGALTLAAVGVGNSFFIPFLVFFIGLSMAQNPFIAQALGAKKREDIAQIFQMTLWLSIAWAVLVFIMIRNMGFGMSLAGIEDSLIPVSVGYLQAISWGLIPTFALIVLANLNESLMTPKVMMIASFIGLPCNVALNAWLMNGGWGVPPLGAVGLGWATTCVRLLLLVIVVGYVLRTHAKSYGLLLLRKVEMHWLRKFLRVGLPISMTMLIRIGVFSILSALVARHGIIETAAHQISLSLNGILYMVTTGLGVAISTRTAFYVGKRDQNSVILVGKLGLAYGLGGQMILSVLVLIFSAQIVGLYTSDPAVAGLTIMIIFYLLAGQVLEGLNTIARSILQGVRDTKVPMLVTLVTFWVLNLPVGFYLGDTLGYGVIGYWIVLTAATVLSTLYMTYRAFEYLALVRKGPEIFDYNTE